MTSKKDLKTYFKTGAKPTSGQFSELIDSSVTVANTTTDPGILTSDTIYLAVQLGTYNYFLDNNNNPLQLSDGDNFCLFYFDSQLNYWTKIKSGNSSKKVIKVLTENISKTTIDNDSLTDSFFDDSLISISYGGFYWQINTDFTISNNKIIMINGFTFLNNQQIIGEK